MEEKEVLVKVEGLSKKFCKDLKTSLWYGLKDLVSNLGDNKEVRLLRPKEFWAVKNINFELRRGECLGIIGHNGAGKSTLLKILNGLIKPDAGKVIIKGRVSALIELGAGFNPILTGRENIFNNGAVLGFTREEILKKLDDIIDFAEIREFIDMPVQNYSSGMKVRLGFAVAAQMEPDVLIIDEVLAVGDVGFRTKCMNRISELIETCAIIFVSHSMPQIAKLCSSAILLEKGKLVHNSNNVADTILTFLNAFQTEKSKNFVSEEALLAEINLSVAPSKRGGQDFVFERKEEIKFILDLELSPEIKNFFITILFHDIELKPVAAITSLSDQSSFTNMGRTQYSVKIENCFAPGRYTVDCNAIEILNQKQWGKVLFQFNKKFTITVKNSYSFTHVPIQLRADWNQNLSLK